MQSTTVRARRTPEERAAMQLESLERCVTRVASQNDQLVIDGFAARGIQATPRVDVFTYNAWQALGRQVRKGEKSVRVTVYIPCNPSAADRAKNPAAPARVRPRTAYVFHISQTDPIPGKTPVADPASLRVQLLDFAQEYGS